MAQPTLLQAAEELIHQGLNTIDIYPVFFVNGNHVGKDIPVQAAELIEKFPECRIRILDYFGSYENLDQVYVTHLKTLGKQKNKRNHG